MVKDMNYVALTTKSLFGAHDRETRYDNTIISYLNSLFGAPIGYNKLNLLLIISYLSFVILILSFDGLPTW